MLKKRLEIKWMVTCNWITAGTKASVRQNSVLNQAVAAPVSERETASPRSALDLRIAVPGDDHCRRRGEFTDKSADMQECHHSRHCRTEGEWEGERQWTHPPHHPVRHSCCADTSHTHASRTLRPLPLLPHPLLALLLILLTTLPVLTVPPRCSQPPPSSNCGDIFPYGQYYYYNASSPARCLRFFHWGCDGDNAFMTEEECLETCEEDSASPAGTPMDAVPSPSPLTTASTDPPTTTGTPGEPTLSPEEICQLPIENFFCVRARVSEVWVYNRNTELCQRLLYFNCQPVPANMVSTEEECIALCGQFSSHYTLPPPPRDVSPSPVAEGTRTADTAILMATPTSSSTDEIPDEATPSPSSTPPTTLIAHLTPPTSIKAPPTLIKAPPTSAGAPPTPAVLEPSPSSEPTSEDPTLATLPSPPKGLTTFDLASIAVGVVVVLLVLVLGIVIASLLHRHRATLKKSSASATKGPMSSRTHHKHSRGLFLGREKFHLYPTPHYV